MVGVEPVADTISDNATISACDRDKSGNAHRASSARWLNTKPAANTISDNAAISVCGKGQEYVFSMDAPVFVPACGSGNLHASAQTEVSTTVDLVGPRMLAPCGWCGDGRPGCPSLGGDLCEKCAIDASLGKCIECGVHGRELCPCDTCDDALDYSVKRLPLRPFLHQECVENTKGCITIMLK